MQILHSFGVAFSAKLYLHFSIVSAVAAARFGIVNLQLPLRVRSLAGVAFANATARVTTMGSADSSRDGPLAGAGKAVVDARVRTDGAVDCLLRGRLRLERW